MTLLFILLALLMQLVPVPKHPWGKFLVWLALALLSVVLVLTGVLHLVMR